MHDGVFKEGSWAKLEKPERLKSLNPEKTLRDLGLEHGDTFADFGSGTGVFIPYALEMVGDKGKVYAVERSEALINRMLQTLQTLEGTPVNLVVCQQDLMNLLWEEEPVQKALMCHVAHELPDLAGFFKLAAEAVVPGGRMSVIEWRVNDQLQGPPMHIRISPEKLSDLLKQAGWEPEAPVFLSNDYYSVTAVRR